MKEATEIIKEAHRILKKVVPENKDAMIEWAVKSQDSVYTNAGAAFCVLNEYVKHLKNGCGDK